MSTLLKGPEERFPRRGGDRRGSAAPDDEVCDDENGGSTRLAGVTSGTRTIGQPTHRHNQSNSCLPPRARRRCAPGISVLALRVAAHPCQSTRGALTSHG